MKILNELYNELRDQDVAVFSGIYGLDDDKDAAVITLGSMSGVFLDIQHIRTLRQEKMAVSHEWAHIQTGATYSVDATPATIYFAERRATRMQIKKLLPFDRMKEAVRDGCCAVYDLAERFNVTEDFVNEAIQYYVDACGLSFNE